MQEKIELQILNAALKQVAINGWSDESLKKTCKKLGFDENCYKLYYPKGISQVVEAYFQQLDEVMVAEIRNNLNIEPKIRDRIKQAVMIRINLLARDRLLTQKTMAFLSLPWNIKLGLKLSWQVANLIWYEAGNDKSTDYNYYTKRTLLSGVYIATIMYFLNDFSKEYKDTIDFLERKLDNVVQMGKFISRFKSNEK